MLARITRFPVISSVPRVAMTVGARHMSSLGETFEKKGKVEEDRFMRAQDAANLKKIHDAMLNQAKAAAEAHESVQFKDHIHPVMLEIKGMLASSDSLSDKSLEAIARWKLGL